MTLTEFLLARIAEEKAVIRALPQPPADARVTTQSAAVNEYLSRVRPERMLAECEAKRRIVEHEHFDGRSGNYVEPWCITCSGDEELAYLPCPTLRLLALPYADHEDYRQEWKP